MEIYISIDGVLRNTIQKFDYHYKEYYLNSITDEEDSFQYDIEIPILNDNLQKYYKFQSEDEFLNFFYIEFPIEIFGHAGLSYPTAISDLNKLIHNFPEHNFTLVGVDNLGKAKPATLFFLSKNGCLINNIKFITEKNIDNSWNNCDIWITDDKKIIDSCPKGKTAIKFGTEYNDFFLHSPEINKLNNDIWEKNLTENSIS